MGRLQNLRIGPRASGPQTGAAGFLRHAPKLPLALFAAGCLTAGIIAIVRAAAIPDVIPWRDIVVAEIVEGEKFPFVYRFVREQWITLLLCLLPSFLLTLFRQRGAGLILAVAAASVAIFALWLSNDLYLNYESAAEDEILGVTPTPGSYVLKLILIGSVILSAPVMVWLYTRGSILDRYTVRNLAVPFMLCLFGFVGIWLVIDLADNGPDFIDAEPAPGLGTVAYFYAVRIPQILVLTLDVALLLSLLYSLGKMSRSNEIISMLVAGRSLMRILLPIFIAGLFITFVSLALNYQWAPRAERAKEDILQRINEGYESETAAQAVLYRNREEGRTWYVALIPIDFSANNKLRSIEVYQQNADGIIERSWSADSAFWFVGTSESAAGTWRLYYGIESVFDERGIRVEYRPFSRLDVEGWTETPWKLQSGSLNPEFLGVQELRSYIATNSDLPASKLAPFRAQLAHRWALPWRCFVVTLFAAPLGVLFSRRGLLGGVAASVFIYFSMFFATEFFLAIGSGSRMPPALAPWMTNLIFAAIGAALLYLRSRNRELPRLSVLTLPKLRPAAA